MVRMEAELTRDGGPVEGVQQVELTRDGGPVEGVQQVEQAEQVVSALVRQQHLAGPRLPQVQVQQVALPGHHRAVHVEALALRDQNQVTALAGHGETVPLRAWDTARV